jgi:ABC-type uncharacterized transport system permease subunit
LSVARFRASLNNIATERHGSWRNVTTSVNAKPKNIFSSQLKTTTMTTTHLKPLHIAFLTPMAQVTLEAVRRLLPAGCTIAFAQTSTKAEQIKLLADADVVMIAGTFIEGDVIRQAPRLKMNRSRQD